MVVRKLPGEPYGAYQDRVWEAGQLLERLDLQRKVLDSLVSATTSVYTDEAWLTEGRKLEKIIALELVDTSREILALWGLVPSKKADEDPDDLPF